jgi:hypothetical protein
MWQRWRNIFISPQLPKPLFRKARSSCAFLCLHSLAKMPRLVTHPARGLVAAATSGPTPPAMATTAASALPVAAASLALPWRSWKALLDVTIAWSLEGSCWIVEIKACCRSSTLSGTSLCSCLLDSLTLLFVALEHLCTRRTGLHGRLQHLPSDFGLVVAHGSEFLLHDLVWSLLLMSSGDKPW